MDTCVLLPITLVDLLLRLAEAKTYRILWSEEILVELERNLILKIDLEPTSARRRINAMREHFPDALVEDYESLTGVMTCDEKDRHVLAAAVRANAELLVTFNLKDFPPASSKPFEVEVVGPDDFLLDQLDLHRSAVLRCLEQQVAAYQDPALTMAECLSHLEQCGLPLFVAAINELTEGAGAGQD
ncbi:PIN domain-containing protein [Paeniglutamicibacter sp. MACA_103]|uniref:PIN domain-containing protein n=1 Tax=Paeniglutamicibacter sp. MACA_103 TaxID=3377337 RepID=UPI00389417ED